jgi:hypothetical protein
VRFDRWTLQIANVSVALVDNFAGKQTLLTSTLARHVKTTIVRKIPMRGPHQDLVNSADYLGRLQGNMSDCQVNTLRAVYRACGEAIVDTTLDARDKRQHGCGAARQEEVEQKCLS